MIVNIMDYKKKAFIFFFLGIISGIPFLLVLSTLSFWLAELQIPISIIGTLTFVTIPYSLKLLWAPFIDNFKPGLLNKLKNGKCFWGIIANIFLTISIIGLGFSNPGHNLVSTVMFAVLVSFFASIQDIVIDALRIELTSSKLSGIMAAAESIGFRTGMFLSGASTLYIAEYFSWPIAYTTMGGIVFIGSITFLILHIFCTIKENEIINKKTINNQFIESIVLKNKLTYTFFYSFYNIFSQPYFSSLLFFIFFFKFADSTLNSISASFIYNLGFTKIEYANISKFFGIGMMICGSIMGGTWIQRWDLTSCLKSYGCLQIMAACMFIIQTYIGHNTLCLIFTIGLESFASGFGSVGFLAYLSKFCRISFSATSFTLFYSCGSFFRILISLFAGWCADYLGWAILFSLVILFTIPMFYYLKKIETLFISSSNS